MTKRKPLNRGNKKENLDGGKAGKRPPRRPGRASSRGEPPRQRARETGLPWLYGFHAVEAALKNPRRTFHKLVGTDKALKSLGVRMPADLKVERATAEEIASHLPEGAVHQGLALHVAPLPSVELEDVLAPVGEEVARPLVVLDQVSDPHNVGAILRSAAAFGAAAVVVQDRHAPQVSGVLAKSASGALEHMPLIRVTNLARALETMGGAGYFRIGLAGEAESALGEIDLPEKLALVLGAEGPGLRRLTREKCDTLIKLPTEEPISSLNVSNAAAVALFAVRHRQS